MPLALVPVRTLRFQDQLMSVNQMINLTEKISRVPDPPEGFTTCILRTSLRPRLAL